MANEDSRENSVLSDALSIAGAGILLAGGIGAAMKMKSSFSKSAKNIIKNADDVVDDVSKSSVLKNSPPVDSSDSEIILKNKPNVDAERQGQKERSAEIKRQQEAEAKNARQKEIERQKQQEINAELERQKQQEASSGGTSKPTTLGYNDVNVGDNFKDEVKGFDDSYTVNDRTNEHIKEYEKRQRESAELKEAKEREKQEIAERKKKHQEEVRKRKEQEELEKKNKPASKVDQYAEKYGSPKKSKSKWRNWLRENQDSGNVADNVSQLTSNSSMLFTKDGYREMQDTFANGGDIGGTFELVSSALKSKDNSYVGTKNINNVVNSNSEGSILKLQEAKRNVSNTSNVEEAEKAISKRKKDANKMKENRELNKNLLANAEDRFADSDELVTVIHGGNKSRIERFMSTGGGAYPIEMEVGGSNGKLQNVGMQFHSDYEERATQYANRAVDGLNSTPAVVTAKVPAKYLHRNSSRHSGGGDEFMLPQEHWDKVQDLKMFEPGSVEWESGSFYDEEDMKYTASNLRKKLNITDR